MGHGWELYCRSGMKELGDFGVFRGLDKILGIALGMVQMGDFVFLLITAWRAGGPRLIILD